MGRDANARSIFKKARAKKPNSKQVRRFLPLQPPALASSKPKQTSRLCWNTHTQGEGNSFLDLDDDDDLTSESSE